jgi:hypothetical protein
MSEFIPGPWNIGTKNGARVWSENGETLIADADVSESLRKEIKKANARLIAAAPDLLDALMTVPQGLLWSDDDLWRWHDKARAAIAKATGGEK